MIETLEYKGKLYPSFQASGNAARFIIPLAQEVCNGEGLDIGYSKPEWKLPGAHGVDPTDSSTYITTKSRNGKIYNLFNKTYQQAYDDDKLYDATNLPQNTNFDGVHHSLENKHKWDYIFSSHCLEHLDDWVRVLDYWYDCIRVGGVMFLYLPAYDQEYWRPWNNTKHKNIFTPEIMYDYFIQKGYKKVFVSGVDLNNSFSIMGEK